MADDGPTGELVALQAVHHSNVGAQVAAPAHAHGGEHGHVVGVCQTGVDQVFHDADGSTGSTQGSDGNCDALSTGEAEQGHQDELDLGAQPGQKTDAFVSSAGVAALGHAVGQHHHQGTDDQNTGNDAQTHVHAALAAFQQGIDETGTGTAAANLAIVVNVDQRAGAALSVALGILAVDLGGLMEHQTGGNDGTDDGTQITDEHRNTKAFADGRAQTDHKGGDDQAHAEGGTDVAQSGQLVLLEEATEIVVLCQSQDGRVIGQVSGEDAHGTGAGQAIEGLDQGGHQLVQQENDAELRPQSGNGTGQNRDGHDVEDRVDQQIVSGVHHGIEHVGGAHLGAQQDEEAEEDHNENGNFFADGLFHAFWQNFFFFLFKHFKYLSPEGKTNLYINRRNYSVGNHGSQGRNE